MSEIVKTILTADSRQFDQTFQNARKKVTDFHQSILKVGAVLGGAAIFAGVVNRFNAVRNAVDELNDRSKRLELPIEELQRLEAAATMSGTSVELLSKSLRRAQLNAAEAVKGNKTLAAEFDALGISASAFLQMGTTEQLLAISRGFNGAADQGLATSAVFKVMGKSAGELVPLLRDGEQGLEAISNRLRVLGSQDADAVAALNDEIDLLSKNIDVGLKQSLLSLRPQIESTVKLLSDAADGLATMLDPAIGIGRQGGALGGAQMLGTIDLLNRKMEGWKKAQEEALLGGVFQDYPAKLAKAGAAVQTLQARFEALDPATKLHAQRLAEFERLRKSGLGEEDLKKELEHLDARTEEGLKAVQAEKDLAAASAETARNLASQKDSAEKLSKELIALRDNLAGRIFDLQTPTVRRDAAQADLNKILKEANAGSVSEIKNRVDSGTDEERMKALKWLDAGLTKLEQIKRANEEIRAASQAGMDSVNSIYQQDESKFREGVERGDLKMDREKAAKTAREEFDQQLQALKLEATGRKEMADKLREEVLLRREATSLSEQLGVSEQEALKRLRERADLEKKVSLMQEGGRDQEGGRRPRRGIRRLPNGANDMNAGNNFGKWQWRLGPRGEEGASSGGRISAGIRNTQMERRETERQREKFMKREDPSSKMLERLVGEVEGIKGALKGIGLF